jgi:hypothetical protein
VFVVGDDALQQRPQRVLAADRDELAIRWQWPLPDRDLIGHERQDTLDVAGVARLDHGPHD